MGRISPGWTIAESHFTDLAENAEKVIIFDSSRSIREKKQLVSYIMLYPIINTYTYRATNHHDDYIVALGGSSHES